MKVKHKFSVEGTCTVDPNVVDRYEVEITTHRIMTVESASGQENTVRADFPRVFHGESVHRENDGDMQTMTTEEKAAAFDLVAEALANEWWDGRWGWYCLSPCGGPSGSRF